MTSRRRRRKHLHLVGQKDDQMKPESFEKLIKGCPHWGRLVWDIVKNRISEEQAQEERYRLGRHPIGNENVSILLCDECYKKGDIIYWEDSRTKFHLTWPIELDAFKAKKGSEKNDG